LRLPHPHREELTHFVGYVLLRAFVYYRGWNATPE
jgi:hypothetical protein